MSERRLRGDPNDRGRRRGRGGQASFSDYMGEAAEDLRDEKEERRASRDAFYREEAADRRQDRDIRGERYAEFEREELLDERCDRREEREISDHVRLRRSSLFGGAFASEEDRAFRRIKQREAREDKLGQYRGFIQQCERRIREYHTVEDWLLDLMQSGFGEDAVGEIRAEARERKLSLMSEQSQVRLSVAHRLGREERQVLIDQDNVMELEGMVYDDILLACDTRDVNRLESALANLRACNKDVEDVLMRIPRMAARQQRKYNSSDTLGYVLQFSFKGLKIGTFLAPVALVAGCTVGLGGGDGFWASFGSGFAWAFVSILLGGAVGAVIGIIKGNSSDHFDFSV